MSRPTAASCIRWVTRAPAASDTAGKVKSTGDLPSTSASVSSSATPSGSMPRAVAPARIEPMLVPPTASIGMLASRNARSTPTSAMPRAPPPL